MREKERLFIKRPAQMKKMEEKVLKKYRQSINIVIPFFMSL